MKRKTTIGDLIKEYFKKHPGEDVTHGPVVDWVEKHYFKLYSLKPRDTWRNIRSFHEKGWLIKVKKGVYRYDPNQIQLRKLENFTASQKEEILKRDGYKCVVCGRGREDGIELHVDHINPKYYGGKATILSGETMCAQHNFIKKHSKGTESGKKMFIRFYDLAKSEDNKEVMKFCVDILDVYEKHNINGHIVWEK